MTRFSWNTVFLLTILVSTVSVSAFGQNLFGQREARQEDSPLTEERKAAGERESIF